MPVRKSTHLNEIASREETIANLQFELIEMASYAAEVVQENTVLRRQADNRPKLTREQANAIRALHANGVKQYAIAAEYGVNPATVSRIVRRRYYA
ncbi:helix-turn-helix domain-containing protein [Kutzneria chonburiensis]|uniref:Helix-turn-helix domain-containing protein n=1 Tax=Kutzneria chonburiensis TaxID=1483604 RepID=A0ABV6N3W1_9PSEU|nr:helix-turn-helix domain-containing protein [Kutzneria chonburiensis]